MNPFIPITVYEDEYQTQEARKLENEIDRIEKELIEDAHNYSEEPIYALSDYLASDNLDPDILECISAVIKNSVSCPFNERHKPINRIINAAIRYKACELAKESFK